MVNKQQQHGFGTDLNSRAPRSSSQKAWFGPTFKDWNAKQCIICVEFLRTVVLINSKGIFYNDILGMWISNNVTLKFS